MGSQPDPGTVAVLQHFVVGNCTNMIIIVLKDRKRERFALGWSRSLQ